MESPPLPTKGNFLSQIAGGMAKDAAGLLDTGSRTCGSTTSQNLQSKLNGFAVVPEIVQDLHSLQQSAHTLRRPEERVIPASDPLVEDLLQRGFEFEAHPTVRKFSSEVKGKRNKSTLDTDDHWGQSKTNNNYKIIGECSRDVATDIGSAKELQEAMLLMTDDIQGAQNDKFTRSSQFRAAQHSSTDVELGWQQRKWQGYDEHGPTDAFRRKVDLFQRMRCFKCLSTEHKVACCRNKVRCWRCLNIGHKAVSCPDRRELHGSTTTLPHHRRNYNLQDKLGKRHNYTDYNDDDRANHHPYMAQNSTAVRNHHQGFRRHNQFGWEHASRGHRTTNEIFFSNSPCCGRSDQHCGGDLSPQFCCPILDGGTATPLAQDGTHGCSKKLKTKRVTFATPLTHVYNVPTVPDCDLSSTLIQDSTIKVVRPRHSIYNCDPMLFESLITIAPANLPSPVTSSTTEMGSKILEMLNAAADHEWISPLQSEQMNSFPPFLCQPSLKPCAIAEMPEEGQLMEPEGSKLMTTEKNTMIQCINNTPVISNEIPQDDQETELECILVEKEFQEGIHVGCLVTAPESLCVPPAPVLHTTPPSTEIHQNVVDNESIVLPQDLGSSTHQAQHTLEVRLGTAHQSGHVEPDNACTQVADNSRGMDKPNGIAAFIDFISCTPPVPLLQTPPRADHSQPMKGRLISVENKITQTSSVQRKSSRLADKAKLNPGKDSVQLAQRVLINKLGEVSPNVEEQVNYDVNFYSQHVKQPLTSLKMEAIKTLVEQGNQPKSKKRNKVTPTPITREEVQMA